MTKTTMRIPEEYQINNTIEQKTYLVDGELKILGQVQLLKCIPPFRLPKNTNQPYLEVFQIWVKRRL